MSGSDLHSPKATGIELERLLFFSDAVFAIAITLLVLEIKVPERETIHTAAELGAALGGLLPHYFAFFLSFGVIGYYWYVHHLMFRYIRQWNDVLVFINLALLLCIAFLPFPVALLGSFRHFAPALVFYSAALTVAGALQVGLWLYATSGHRLVAPDLPKSTVGLVLLRATVQPVMFAVSIPLSLVSPGFALLAILLVVPVVRIARARLKRAGA